MTSFQAFFVILSNTGLIAGLMNCRRHAIAGAVTILRKDDGDVFYAVVDVGIGPGNLPTVALFE